MSERIAIKTDKAPAARPIFHQGVKQGPFVQVSGQGPQDPATGEYLYPGDIKKQTIRTLENVLAILEAAGATMDDVLILRVYITKREDFAPMSEAYGEFVKAHCKGEVLPCRTTVTVGLPNEDMLVEIDALAVVS
ncbi:MAG: RidA family protein [Cellulomonadaceae bacterium]|jgi:reactive intermediate/imine deaminase|nr:RidA family protein [Cellulomonadaceae bacterium]